MILQLWQHVREDFKTQIFLITQAVGAPLERPSAPAAHQLFIIPFLNEELKNTMSV